MLKKYGSYIVAVVAALAVAGCADDIAVDPEGVMLHLEITDVSPGVTTRAVPADLPQPVQELFHLAIANEQGRTVYDDAFASSVGPFAPGRFTLSVDHGQDELALDAPVYAGRATDYIYKGMEHVISIEARVANALMSIAYQVDGREALDEVFESYGVTFTLDGRTASIEGPEPTASAYFPAGAVPEVTFHAVRRDDGRTVTTSLSAALAAHLPLEAGRHAKVTLGVDADRVQIAKVDIEEVTINQTIPPSWLPKPKATVSGFDADGTLHNVETNTTGEVKADFITSSALQDVELTLDIQDPAYSYLSGTHLLSEMSAEQIETLRTAGIELPAVGTEAGTITLTRFATNLQTNKGAETTNTLTLRVKANDRWDTESPQTYSIVVEKPVFAARVLPGNIWTREFTISPLRAEDVTKGNFDVLSKSITYQVQQNGVWTTLNERTVKSLTPATAYTIRACYRGCVYSEPMTVNTFPLTVLENGNLDADCTESGSDSGLSGYGRRFSFSGWGTVNEQTTEDCGAAKYAYNSRSGTRPTGTNDSKYLALSDDAVSGKAVWLGTIGWGYGGTYKNPEHRTPAQLFLGSLDNVDYNSDEPKPNYGITFDSHPTAVRFYYKYAPYNGDQAIVEIALYNGDTLLGEGKANYGSQSSWKEQTLELTYDQDEAKLELMPDKLIVKFISGSKKETGMVKKGIFNYYHTGSQLWLDEIALVYDK